MKVLSENKVYTFEETIKKSKFITYIGVVNTKEDLDQFINKYKRNDARHNCWAYKIGTDGNQYGYNNDGEPSGTAGEPLLKLLEVNNLTNIIIFCVRYFGGIKLGTGGLQKAYSNGAIQLLKTITTKKLELLHLVTIKFEIQNQKAVLNCLRTLKVQNIVKHFDQNLVYFTFLIEELSKLESVNKLVSVIDDKWDYF
ncbi:hypothetical protein SCHIN_v1c00830 [Spiroplasma chinense]|uniref:Impact N-terminal domain-containing protein n=1 Tax=Spiroplasma chinense TaxID=216932 RepID=A0A5B9Y2V4_9MOLU|nr:YigZ family protein [Spiroplasma chinense]QEH61281.1 hypothetical protein SCHIN_v1c00830 [Spiroplasma chinense]